MALSRYSLIFYLNMTKHYPKKGGYPIACRIRMNRHKTEFQIGKYCEKGDWSEEFELAKEKRSINKHIEYIKSEMEDIHYRMLKEGKVMSAKALKLAYSGESEKVRLVDSFEADIKKISRLKEEYTKGTIGMYKTTLMHLKSFLQKERVNNIYVQSFDYNKVKDFEYFLKVDKEMGVNTATKYLKKLNAFYTRLLKAQVIEKTPFEGFKFKLTKTHKTFLTIPQVEKIQELEGMADHITLARDIFVFAIFTGLRYSDVYNLRNSNIEEDEKGNEWIRIVMKKTNDFLRIPLIKPAKEIIELYKKQSEASGRPLPKMVEQRYNLYLKEIGTKAEIDKKLTSHVARHTFATSVRIKYGIPIEVTSKLLGHRKLATTMVYSQITDDEVLRYMKD